MQIFPASECIVGTEHTGKEPGCLVEVRVLLSGVV